MNEDNLLQSVRKSWLKQEGISSDFLHYLVEHQGIKNSLIIKLIISNYVFVFHIHSFEISNGYKNKKVSTELI